MRFTPAVILISVYLSGFFVVLSEHVSGSHPFQADSAVSLLQVSARATGSWNAPWSGNRNQGSQRDDILYDLLIVIPAAAHEIERREAVRTSWARYLDSPSCEVCQRHKVRLLFVVGNETNITASEQEAAEHGDMGVLQDFGQAQYYTLRSEKTLRSIRFAVQHYRFKFMLKCDTDSWVYLDRLLELFDAQHLWDKERMYAGNFDAGAGAQANGDETAKWYDPVYPKMTGLHEYPFHAKGAGYVLSRALAEALATPPLGFWQDLPSEDVATGFWLEAIQKERVDLPISIQPHCSSDAIIDHYVTPALMAERWEALSKHGTPCWQKPQPSVAGFSMSDGG